MAHGRLNKRSFSDENCKADAFAKRQKLSQHRKSLPIASVEKRLVEEVQKHHTLIIVGETGSGKTTLVGMRCSHFEDVLQPLSSSMQHRSKQPNGTYRALANGQEVHIHPMSVLFHEKPECIAYNELVETKRKYIRNTTRIDYLWLHELAPQFYAMQN